MAQKNLIAVSAKIGNGKDTLYDFLQQKTRNVYENKKFAWKLKEIAELLTGIPAAEWEKESVKNSYLPEEWNYIDANGVEQRLTCREFMQKMGTEGMRNGLHNNVWVNAMFADYKPTMRKYDFEGDPELPNWLITDCRFPNEAAAIKNRGGIIIRINRDFTWEQFCKAYGIKNLSDGSGVKKSAIDWGLQIQYLDQTEEIQGAIKKIFHSSETALDNYQGFDYIINNVGSLEDYENEIKKCLNTLQLGEIYENIV